jgi:signal recognition particle GTPase
MMDTMTDAELDNPELINGKSRERISKASGKSEDDVSRLVFFYKQSLIVATWLQQK